MKRDNSFNTCVAVIIIALAARIFLYGLYQIPSESMEPTLLIGDMLVGNKFELLQRVPQHNDIIVFNDPEYDYAANPVQKFIQQYIVGPRNLTKRIIAVPGDHLMGACGDNKPILYRNGVPLQEPYTQYTAIDREPSAVQPDAAVDYWDGSDIFNVRLKANQYWVMGDNRDNSYDSRVYGPIDIGRIRARICFRFFSADTALLGWRNLLCAPWTLCEAIRWQRCFTMLPLCHTTIKEQ